LVAAPAKLAPFLDSGEVEVRSSIEGRVVLADGFARHGEPVRRILNENGGVEKLVFGGVTLSPEAALIEAIAAKRR
jgi:D-alanyl-D-alanine carboxypeptidase